MSYVEKSNQYIDDVLSGKILSCKYVKLACKRQKDDLKRKRFKYKFDESRANRVCQFIELLPHIKGKWAGTPISLEGWQCFILTTVFGWVDKIGLRRFKTAYVEVPRKNAKSTLSSGVALYLMCADSEAGAEVYSAATTRDQAKIVWQDAKRMVDKCPDLRNELRVSTSANTVFQESSASLFRALSRDQGGNLDGLNVHAAIIDELHAHKTRDVWDVIETGTGARTQPLIWGITTAGFNRAGICYEQRSYALKLLTKAAKDEEYFGIVYTIDESDNWTDPLVWEKANPNWKVSVNPDDIARLARKAQEMSSAVNNFLTKRLNVWVNADTAWMDMIKWDASKEQKTLEDMSGCESWLGIDLATKTDIAAINITCKKDNKYYTFGKYFLPEDAVEDGRNSQYGGWVRDERIIATDGSTIDFETIKNEIRHLMSHLRVQEVAFDPWQATQLANEMLAEGVPMVEVRATVQNFSEPMKVLEEWIFNGSLKHDGCPVLGWMISNVVAHLDAKENIYPRKEFSENKIDGVVALIMSISRIIRNECSGSIDDFLANDFITG